MTSSSNTPLTHDLKCWVGFFQDVLDGRKTFEIRQDDRAYKVGHTLLLREWSPDEQVYTGRECRRVVSYITAWEQKPGFVVMALTPVSEREEFVRCAPTHPHVCICRHCGFKIAPKPNAAPQESAGTATELVEGIATHRTDKFETALSTQRGD